MSLRAAPSFSFTLLCRSVRLGVHGRVCVVGCARSSVRGWVGTRQARRAVCLCIFRGSRMLSERLRAVVHMCVCVPSAVRVWSVPGVHSTDCTCVGGGCVHVRARDAACTHASCVWLRLCVRVHVCICVFMVLVHVRVALRVWGMHSWVCTTAVHVCVPGCTHVHLQVYKGRVGLIAHVFRTCVLVGGVMAACACVYTPMFLGSG